MQLRSRPSRARGLKPNSGLYSGDVPMVAPLAGAWIETSMTRHAEQAARPSRPSRARGLKQGREPVIHGAKESRPSRARGLKQYLSARTCLTSRRAPRGRVD